MVVKRVLTNSFGVLVVLFFIVTLAGCAVRVMCTGRIAPGIMVCGMDLSGKKEDEALEAVKGCLPEVLLEICCQFPKEKRDEVEAKGKEYSQTVGTIRVMVQETALYLTMEEPLLRMRSEDIIEAVWKKSSEVKVWEWLYAAIAKKPFRSRQVEVGFVWEEKRFGELLSVAEKLLEREKVEATLRWDGKKCCVTESREGYRIDKKAAWEAAEQAFTRAIERLSKGRKECIVLRLALTGEVLMPTLTTEQAKQCDTKIAEFSTQYKGAGNGRVQNLMAGAARLDGRVILPGEEFSTAAALLPFTEENGYAAGGTYIDGQLSESIGGGVCQLSSTLYNALLYTKLEITKRSPHSIPVGYVLPGRDAAIAGDYKDLCFRNTTKAPVLLLCEAAEGQVKVVLYGAAETMREGVIMESIVTEETKEGMTVEVYRTEMAADGGELREKISRDAYRYSKTGE